MTNVAVRRPNLNDVDELYLFFRIVITNTYKMKDCHNYWMT